MLYLKEPSYSATPRKENCIIGLKLKNEAYVFKTVHKVLIWKRQLRKNTAENTTVPQNLCQDHSILVHYYYYPSIC